MRRRDSVSAGRGGSTRRQSLAPWLAQAQMMQGKEGGSGGGGGANGGSTRRGSIWSNPNDERIVIPSQVFEKQRLEIHLDGPFGAPSSSFFQVEHAVLVATGIGVTPFSSILQSIMFRYMQARRMCPNCSHSWADDLGKSLMNLTKVDFFWINRDQKAFEWFVSLLDKMEQEQLRGVNNLDKFLDFHLYMTKALQKNDMRAVGLQLAMDLLHEKENRDVLTKLKVQTNAGRPNWNRVFKKLRDESRGKVTVFYCGNPALARILRQKCNEFGFGFRKEVF